MLLQKPEPSTLPESVRCAKETTETFNPNP